MISRRRVVACGTLAAMLPGITSAQVPARTVRIGILNFGDRPAPGGPMEPLVAQLRTLGYVEGTNVVYERRYAGGQREAYAALAAELVRMSLDLIYAPGSDIARAFRAASPRVPVVFTVSDDPVATGLVRSMAQPGGMFTGVTLMSPELAGKRLELLKSTLASLRRVAILYDPAHQANYVGDMKVAAERMDLEFLELPFHAPTEFDARFAEAKQRGADAMFIEPSRFTLVYAKRVGELAIEHRIAAISAYDLSARAGALLSYGARYEEQAVRAAGQIDRILRGAKPADLPVEQPTRFALLVNLRTARALGITVPQTVLLRADEVIE